MRNLYRVNYSDSDGKNFSLFTAWSEEEAKEKASQDYTSSGGERKDFVIEEVVKVERLEGRKIVVLEQWEDTQAEQAQLEAILDDLGYTPEDEYEGNNVLFTKYAKEGIGVRIERNIEL